MAILEIKKLGNKNFWHYYNDNEYSASDIRIDFEGDYVQLTRSNGAIVFKKEGFLFSDISVYDVGGGEETFATIEDLEQRLIDLGYVAYGISVDDLYTDFTQLGGYSGTSQDLKDEIDGINYDNNSTYQTKAQMLADVPTPNDYQGATVNNDATQSNNGRWAGFGGVWIQTANQYDGEIARYETKAVSGETVYDKNVENDINNRTRNLGEQNYIEDGRIQPDEGKKIWSFGAGNEFRGLEQWYTVDEDKIFNLMRLPIVRALSADTFLTDGIHIKIGINSEFVFQTFIPLSDLAHVNAQTTSLPNLEDYMTDVNIPEIDVKLGDVIYIYWYCEESTDRLSFAYMNNLEEDWSNYYRRTNNGVFTNTTPPSPSASSGFNFLVWFVYKDYFQYRLENPKKEDLTLLEPKRIYTTLFDVESGSIDKIRQNSSNIYLDRFINGIAANPSCRFDNLRTSYPIYSDVNSDNGDSHSQGDVEKTNRTINIDGGNSYNDTTVGFEQISSKESVASSEFPKILCIGDSVTDYFLAGQNVESGHPSAFWANIKNEFEKAKIDNGDTGHDCLFVGRKSQRNWNLTYGGVTNRALTAFAEGQGGWSLANHLHHTDERDYVQGVWDLLGLGNASGTDFINSEPQRDLINTTTEGANTPLNTAAFISFMNGRYGSISNYTEALAKANDLQDNPINPFFDKTKIVSGYGFSLKTYLDRYKTLNDDGVTRLSVGTTAGSEVSDVNATDVCTPTHIIIQHSHNDGNSVVIDDLYRQMTDIIKAEATANIWGDIMIGISIMDFTGTYFPNEFTEFVENIVIPDYATRTGYLNLERIFAEFWVSGANEDSEKIFILPTFHIMPTGNSQPYREINNNDNIINSRDSVKVVNGLAPYLHPNGIGHLSIGQQFYAWILYTLTL